MLLSGVKVRVSRPRQSLPLHTNQHAHMQTCILFFFESASHILSRISRRVVVFVMLDFLDSLTTRTHGLFEDEMFEILSVSTAADDYLQISC